MTPFDKALNEAAEIYKKGPSQEFLRGAQWATQHWQNLGAGEFDELSFFEWLESQEDKSVRLSEAAKYQHQKSCATIAALRAEKDLSFETLKNQNEQYRLANLELQEQLTKLRAELESWKEKADHLATFVLGSDHIKKIAKLESDLKDAIETLKKYADLNCKIIKADKLEEWLSDSRANPDRFVVGELYVFGLTNNIARQCLAWIESGKES